MAEAFTEVAHSTASNALSGVTDQFLCVYCKQRPAEVSVLKLLDCLHAACSHCLHGRVNENHAVVCSACQHSTHVPVQGVLALPCHHVATLSKSEPAGAGDSRSSNNVEVSVCDECDDPTASFSFCQTCGQSLCEFHVSNHRRSRRTKLHKIVGLSERHVGQESGSGCSGLDSRCPLHGESLSLYCKDCRKPICSQCVSFGHGKHDRQAMSDELTTAAKQRLENAAQRSQAESKVRLQQIAAAEENRMKLIDEAAEAVSEEIEKHFQELWKQLEERKEALLAEVGRHHRQLASPSEAVNREAKRVLEAMTVANMMAVITQQLSADAAVLEEEGVISKRLEELQHETTTLASRAEENANINSLPVFTPCTEDGVKVSQTGSVSLVTSICLGTMEPSVGNHQPQTQYPRGAASRSDDPSALESSINFPGFSHQTPWESPSLDLYGDRSREEGHVHDSIAEYAGMSQASTTYASLQLARAPDPQPAPQDGELASRYQRQQFSLRGPQCVPIPRGIAVHDQHAQVFNYAEEKASDGPEEIGQQLQCMVCTHINEPGAIICYLCNSGL